MEIIRKVKLGFTSREELEDFLLTPCLAYGKVREINQKADAIGIKFGYWGVYIAYLRVFVFETSPLFDRIIKGSPIKWRDFLAKGQHGKENES